MPMPKRRNGESERAYVARFMLDETMRQDYPKRDQRLAIAFQEARRAKKSAIHKAIDHARQILKSQFAASGKTSDYPTLIRLVRGEAVTPEMLLELSSYKGEVGDWAKSSLEALQNVNQLQTESFQTELSVCKVSVEQQLVYAWASVIEEDGEPVVDSHGDIIEEAELVKAAHRSLRRMVGKEMHQGEAIAEIVESFVLTNEVQKLLDIELGKVGWLVAMKIHDPDVWQKVKDGELAALSIGGRGIRSEAA